jgi:hypothetical protein
LLNEFALLRVNYVNQVGALWIGVWKKYFSTVQRQDQWKKTKFNFIWMKNKRLVASSKKSVLKK